MGVQTDLIAVAMTLHQRELCALVLRDHADVMDAQMRQIPNRHDGPIPAETRCLTSSATVEMRELAHYIEWGG